MKFNMYSVYDAVSLNFHIPFYMRSNNEALRAFQTALGDPTHEASKHAQDYSLYLVGSFDDDNGLVCSFPCERIS